MSKNESPQLGLVEEASTKVASCSRRRATHQKIDRRVREVRSAVGRIVKTGGDWAKTEEAKTAFSSFEKACERLLSNLAKFSDKLAAEEEHAKKALQHAKEGNVGRAARSLRKATKATEASNKSLKVVGNTHRQFEQAFNALHKLQHGS